MAARGIACWIVLLGLLASVTAAGFRIVEAAYTHKGGIPRGLAPTLAVASDGTVAGFPMTSRASALQVFRSEAAGLLGIRLQVVTWAHVEHQGRISWVLREVLDGGRLSPPLRQGRVKCDKLLDWGFAELVFEPIEDSEGRDYRLELYAPDVPIDRCVGFRLVRGGSPTARLTLRGGPGSEHLGELVDGTAREENSLKFEIYHRPGD
ncbi:MAG: hypothetical protein U0800_08770 [Isosphaeraceae bacterium]